MFRISARVVPQLAFAARFSLVYCGASVTLTARSLSAHAILMYGDAFIESFPFGPSMLIVWPLTETLTPAGTVTAFFPIRDMLQTPRRLAHPLARGFRPLGLTRSRTTTRRPRAAPAPCDRSARPS